MARMKPEYIEKIYAGWLAKIIGIRFGAPIEGWTYAKIKNTYGDLDHYIVDYQGNFAADDDSNGPIFFVRALEDGKTFDLTAEAVGDALLNYAPYEHGFFWWGGYGVSTEHTAYLNLRSGIKAPKSGSIAQNGSAVAEQIGGQIFIDTWGLVAPGNPDLAAAYAQKAASVTHDGNGVYGGMFIAACISHAFEEQDIRAIIEKGLTYIPADCEYRRVVRAVMTYHDARPENWRDCFQYIFENFGYDRYPGGCHIIPNTAVMILSLLYGGGDFSRTLAICNMCGWDTDCTVGNVATIMGVRCGLNAIDRKWRQPINDLLICSSVIGSLNIADIPYGASYLAKLAYACAGEPLPAPWDEIITKRIDSCHFEYPGSTHAIRVKAEQGSQAPEYSILNTDESTHSGSRSLKVAVKPISPGGRVSIYKTTYYKPEEFHNSRYDPCFSPLIYPGQSVHGSICLPDYCPNGAVARLYVRDASTGKEIEGESAVLKKGVWTELSFAIPRMEDALLDEAGFALDVFGNQNVPMELVCFVDDLYFDGQPDYAIYFSKSVVEKWNHLHKEISQFTRLKGLMYLENDELHLSCTDFGEAYTGHHNWTDYTASFRLVPRLGSRHMVNVRVQGAIRSYSAGLAEGDKLCLYKNENGYRKLTETDYAWELDREYVITVSATGNVIMVAVDDASLIYADADSPYLTGSIGLSVQHGSHCSYRAISVWQSQAVTPF